MWAASLSAAPQLIQGLGLKEPLSTDLDFSESDYILVRAPQTHADYSLGLIDKKTNTVVRKVNFPYQNALDEILLVHINDCNKCAVTLSPVAKIDSTSPYTLSTESIPISDTEIISTLQKITAAGEYRQNANESDPIKSIELIQQSANELKQASQLDDSYWRHYSLLLLAYSQQGLNQKELFHQTLKVIEDETVGDTSIFRAVVLLELSFFETDIIEQHKMYDEAIHIGKTINNQRIYSSALNFKALSLATEARFEQATTLYKEAYSILSTGNNWREALIVLHNLSFSSLIAGQLPESLAYATEQKLLAETFEDQERTVLALYNLAMTYGEIGERFIAEEFLDSAIEKHSKLPNNSFLSGITGGFLLAEKTQRLLEYGAFESALDYANKTRQVFDKLGHPGRSADITHIEGQIAFAMQDYELAETKFIQVINYDQENNRVLLEGIHLLRLTELKVAQKQFIAASEYQSKALKLLSETEDYRALGKAFSQASELLYHLGAYEDAQVLLDRTSAFIEKHALEQEKALLAYRKALVANSVGNSLLATQSLKKAQALIEETLPKIKQRDLRRTYLALQKSIFELTVEVMLSTQPSNLLAPLALAETYRARTLAESINTIQSDDKNTNDALIKQRNSLLDKIQINAAVWHKNEQQVEDYAAVLRETRELSASLEKLEVQIANRNGEPQTLSKPISVEQIPTAQENELIAYYFVGTDISWLWIISNQAIAIYDLPAEQELSNMVNAVLSQINTAPAARQNSTAWEQSSAIEALSKVLLSPLQEHLDNLSIDLITIIPDGPLHGLSFATLTMTQSRSPLIKDYAISYTPSLMINKSLDERLRHIASSNAADILVLANPVNHASAKINFAELPFSYEEAMTIKSIAGEKATILLSEKANKDRLQNELSKPYSILHFATHGLLNKHEPSLSGLALSTSDSSDNHLWLSPEISNTTISADLVVLSSCDSSIGKGISGEGLFSLSRAFIEGGANQVIGTLWSVQDNSTSRLFENFYTYLFDQHLGVAQALQQAQLSIYSDTDNDWSDPYYWAGFQLLGGGANQTYAISQ